MRQLPFRVITPIVLLHLVMQLAFAAVKAQPTYAAGGGCHKVLSPQRSVQVDPHALRIFENIYSDRNIVVGVSERFERAVQEGLASRSKELRAEDIKAIEDPNRLLDQIQYMGYVSGIGTSKGKGTFRNLTAMADYLFDYLGVSMIYALPFLKSPFKDAGFDVSDYKTVDRRFGGDREFRSFISKLRQKRGSFQLDLVLNHVSETHAWAKAALRGEKQYRNYFHFLKTPPEVLDVKLDKNGKPLSARYREKNEYGKTVEVERRVIFPDFADPHHPHYFKTKDADGKDVWIYHTFYPFQFDLNFKNPAVMGEAFRIVTHWANQGADVIRLDAIPFLFKERESDPRTLEFVKSLRYLLTQVAPRTSIIVEACQELSVVQKFFGKSQNIYIKSLGRTLTASSGAQMAYNFDLMAHSWASLLSGDKRYIIESLKNTPELPKGTVWANFLRLHDELTLEMAPPRVREIIQRALLSTGKGVSFRGDLGVGGRMTDFLSHDPRRITLAFSYLLSLKGMPIIYYGDEVMATNNKPYAIQAARERGGQYDARDEGRGPVEKALYDNAIFSRGSTPEGSVLEYVRHFIRVRKERASLRRGEIEILNTSNPSTLAYARHVPGETTLILHNLSEHTVTATVDINLGSRQLVDLLYDRNFNITSANGKIKLELPPFETIWFGINQ
ncbi:MAG: alpha-amylase family glycosyl hydrolase [Bdellovibrionales bacterium]